MSSVEIVSRIEPRRKWSPAEKAALLAEVDAEGGRVTLVARRHRLSESLLYNWRAARKAAVAAANGIEPPEFLQLGVVGQASAERPAVSTISGASMIEVDLPNGVRFRVDASVSEKALARVLRAMIREARRMALRGRRRSRPLLRRIPPGAERSGLAPSP